MTKIGKRLSAILLAMVIVVMLMPLMDTQMAYAKTDYGISNPVVTDIVYDDKDNDVETTWDCIWFGNYPQSDTTGATKEPIKWRVLSVNGNEAFLLADQNLDARQYKPYNEECTWESSSLRTWLNGTFYNAAFNSSEQNAIKFTTVVNDDSPWYSTIGGNDTQDKVYLLSIAEVTTRAYGFPETYTVASDARKAVNTEYARANGVGYDMHPNVDGKGIWWLRSPGSPQDHAAVVTQRGAVRYSGEGVSDRDIAVRPALRLNLSSSAWSYAGKLSSDGAMIPPITGAVVTGIVNYTYTGAELTQSPEVKLEDTTLKEGTDYTISYQNNTNAGTATMIVTGIGSYCGMIRKTFTITKADNPLKITPKTAPVKHSKLKKKAQTLRVSKVMKFTNDLKDKKTYTLSSAKKGKKSFKKYFKINKTTGKVTVKKGLKKGTYKVKVKVKAAGNRNYKASAVKTVTFTVKVK